MARKGNDRPIRSVIADERPVRSSREQATVDGKIKRTDVRARFARQVFVCTLGFAHHNGTKPAPREVRVVPPQEVFSSFQSNDRCQLRSYRNGRSAVSTPEQVSVRGGTMTARYRLRQPKRLPIVSAWYAIPPMISAFASGVLAAEERASMRARSPS